MHIYNLVGFFLTMLIGGSIIFKDKSPCVLRAYNEFKNQYIESKHKILYIYIYRSKK